MNRELAGPSLPRALREARAYAGLTQGQVAARAGVCRTAYAHWEAGARQMRAGRLPEVAGALGVSVYELLAWATT